MADLPIPFSAPMVRALLREIEAPGTGKTQTRRTHPPEPSFVPDGCHHADLGGRPCWWDFWAHDRAETQRFKLPYAVGDRLYVREHWRTSDAYDDLTPSQMGGEEPVIYLADDAMETWGWGNSFVPGRFRQAMHMPRWASRITLLVTEVRVERLQDCSEADAVTEGIIWQDPTDEDREWAKRYAEENGTDADIKGVWIAPGTRQGWGMTQEERNQPQWGPTAACAYRCLWDQINGPGAWALNPWVAAYSFRPILGNIDRIGEVA